MCQALGSSREGALHPLRPRASSHRQKAGKIRDFPEIKAKTTKNRINWTKYEFLLHSNIKIVTFGVT